MFSEWTTFRPRRLRHIKRVKDCPTNTLPDFLKGAVSAAQKDPKCDPFYAMLFGNPAVDYVRCVDRSSAAKVVYR